MIETVLPSIVLGLEVTGIAAILAGAAVAVLAYLRGLWTGADRDAAFKGLRATLGRAILLGLEFLVAADIIATVALDLTVESVMLLAGVVLIRTFLSFALQVEIEGRLPWRGREATR